MEWEHILWALIFVVVGILNLVLLLAAFRQKDKGVIIETFLSAGFMVCLFLALFPPSFLRGDMSALGDLASALVLASLVVSLTRRHRASKSKPPVS
jgi:hypothetical protein